MDEVTRKMLYPKDRKDYTEGFLEAYAKDPMKSRMIQNHGEKYYEEVMRIYRERLDKNDFEIGPQSVEDWDRLREQLKQS